MGQEQSRDGEGRQLKVSPQHFNKTGHGDLQPWFFMRWMHGRRQLNNQGSDRSECTSGCQWLTNLAYARWNENHDQELEIWSMVKRARPNGPIKDKFQSDLWRWHWFAKLIPFKLSQLSKSLWWHVAACCKIRSASNASGSWRQRSNESANSGIARKLQHSRIKGNPG